MPVGRCPQRLLVFGDSDAFPRRGDVHRKVVQHRGEFGPADPAQQRPDRSAQAGQVLATGHVFSNPLRKQCQADAI